MKIRTLVITVAVLVVLSVLAYLGNRPEAAPSSDPRVGKPLLDADTATKAARIVVSEKGKSVELDRGADGTWRVASYYGLPADFEKIAHLVQDLNEAKLDRFVTSSADRLAHMEFGDSSIALGDSSGKQIWSVSFGKAADSGNGKFVRFGTENASFFSSLHVWLDTDPKSWADTRLVTAKTDDVASVEIGFEGEAPVLASRATKNAAWMAQAPAGSGLSQEKISSVVSSLTALRFSDTVPVDDPSVAQAAGHTRSFKLTTFDGKTLSIAFSRKPEERKPKVAPSPTPTPAVADAKTDAKTEAKPAEPEFDTIPAGAVFIRVTSSDAHAPVNEAMKQRAFQIDDFTFTSLPQKAGDLFKVPKAAK